LELINRIYRWPEWTNHSHLLCLQCRIDRNDKCNENDK